MSESLSERASTYQLYGTKNVFVGILEFDSTQRCHCKKFPFNLLFFVNVSFDISFSSPTSEAISFIYLLLLLLLLLLLAVVVVVVVLSLLLLSLLNSLVLITYYIIYMSCFNEMESVQCSAVHKFTLKVCVFQNTLHRLYVTRFTIICAEL